MPFSAANIVRDEKSEVFGSLNQCISDTVVATMLAQNYHWNVTGMNFVPLHNLFQEIYEDHFQAQDDLAERVKAMGGYVEATIAGFLERTSVREQNGPTSAVAMVEHMAETQEVLASTMSACGAVAAISDDKLTEDLCIERGQQHEKFAWMLRAHLKT